MSEFRFWIVTWLVIANVWFAAGSVGVGFIWVGLAVFAEIMEFAMRRKEAVNVSHD